MGRREAESAGERGHADGRVPRRSAGTLRVARRWYAPPQCRRVVPKRGLLRGGFPELLDEVGLAAGCGLPAALDRTAHAPPRLQGRKAVRDSARETDELLDRAADAEAHGAH